MLKDNMQEFKWVLQGCLLTKVLNKLFLADWLMGQ